jgi:hypothetical protein
MAGGLGGGRRPFLKLPSVLSHALGRDFLRVSLILFGVENLGRKVYLVDGPAGCCPQGVCPLFQQRPSRLIPCQVGVDEDHGPASEPAAAAEELDVGVLDDLTLLDGLVERHDGDFENPLIEGAYLISFQEVREESHHCAGIGVLEPLDELGAELAGVEGCRLGSFCHSIE